MNAELKYHLASIIRKRGIVSRSIYSWPSDVPEFDVLVLADYLEEQGDKRAGMIRSALKKHSGKGGSLRAAQWQNVLLSYFNLKLCPDARWWKSGCGFEPHDKKNPLCGICGGTGFITTAAKKVE